VRAGFVDEVADSLHIERKDLIEKDIILHQILSDLSKDRFFSNHFFCKGGACLMKCYLGYARFPDDADFMWKDLSVFAKNPRERKAYQAAIIDKTGSLLELIAKKRGLDFKCVRNNPDYVQIGIAIDMWFNVASIAADKLRVRSKITNMLSSRAFGAATALPDLVGVSRAVQVLFGSKTNDCRFKLWYDSEVLKHRQFLKVDLNFVRPICFPAKKGQLRGPLKGKDGEIESLFPQETAEYSRAIRFDVHDVRDILCEKISAVLTRRSPADFLDVYLICKKFGFRLENLEDCILMKIKSALRFYGICRVDLKEKISLLNSGKLFDWGTYPYFVLSQIDVPDLYEFHEAFVGFLKNIVTLLSYGNDHNFQG